jgi:hypothetical protein
MKAVKEREVSTLHNSEYNKDLSMRHPNQHKQQKHRSTIPENEIGHFYI